MDVTNIVAPVVSVITNIGMDHTDVLGDTIEQIAGEKAGIIKPGVPVVTCATQPEAVKVIQEKAQQLQSSVYLAGDQFSYHRLDSNENGQSFHFTGPFRDLDVRIRMQGSHQCDNAAAALMVLELLRQYMAFMLDDNDIVLGLENAFWAGRFEKVVDEPRIVLDGAHNPEGAESLAKSIMDVYPHNKLILMMGMLANKHHEAYLQHILPLVDTLILTEPDFRRKMDAAELLQIVERVRPAIAKQELEIIVEPEWAKALDLLKSRTEAEDLGVVSGTLYLIADVRAALCIKPILKKVGESFVKYIGTRSFYRDWRIWHECHRKSYVGNGIHRYRIGCRFTGVDREVGSQGSENIYRTYGRARHWSRSCCLLYSSAC